MARPDHSLSVRTARGLSRLRHRRDVEWLVLYLGGAWILYESVALTADTFDLPVLVARVTAVVLALGAIIAIPLARWYELTARALDRTEGEDLVDVPGVPDVLEPALARSYRKVGRRSVMLAGAGSAVLFSGFFFVLWNAWAEGHAEVAPDPRISVAVFPFRASGTEAGVAGEGIADLLLVTLDGTPGVRVMDPAGFWRSLRSERGAPARAPELDEALRLSRRAPARRFVTGTVISGATTLDLIARVYDTESGAALASLRSSADTDDLATAVDSRGQEPGAARAVRAGADGDRARGRPRLYLRPSSPGALLYPLVAPVPELATVHRVARDHRAGDEAPGAADAAQPSTRRGQHGAR
jgi:hypothetical protein